MKLFSCLTRLSMKFNMIIKTIVDILTFISAEHLAQLIEDWTGDSMVASLILTAGEDTVLCP